MREGVANDLMRVLGEGRGYATQKLKLVPTVYADGSPKLLLDSTHASDPNQPGVAFDTIGSKKRLVDGYIVKLGPDDKPLKDAHGRHIVDNDIQDQGRHKIKMLAMGDRDALGSTGATRAGSATSWSASTPATCSKGRG